MFDHVRTTIVSEDRCCQFVRASSAVSFGSVHGAQILADGKYYCGDGKFSFHKIYMFIHEHRALLMNDVAFRLISKDKKFSFDVESNLEISLKMTVWKYQ